MALFAVSAISGIDARFELWNQLKVRGPVPVVPVPVILNLLLDQPRNQALGFKSNQTNELACFDEKSKPCEGLSSYGLRCVENIKYQCDGKFLLFIQSCEKVQTRLKSATLDNPAFGSFSMILCNVS